MAATLDAGLTAGLDVALIEPQTPENVGAVARVMANFGFKHLVVANPKCDVTSERAMALAVHAKDILKSAKIVSIEQVFSYDTVIATTSKLGTDYNINRTPIAINELAKKLSESKIANINTVIVFGREGDGLSNHELERADIVVTIPASRYAALNLSHAAAIVLYEFANRQLEQSLRKKFNPAKRQDKEALFSLADELISSLKLKNSGNQKKLFRRIVGQSMLSSRQLYMLFGLIRKIAGKK